MAVVRGFEEHFTKLNEFAKVKDFYMLQYTTDMKQELLAEVASMKKDIECSRFVSVLIDGDCMNFLDHFVGKGDQGGGDAAQSLRNAVLRHLDRILPGRDRNTKVIVRVYANLKGLIRPYRDNNIVADPSILEAFVRGFNMYDPLFDFVDAGNGKECADEKLKGKSNIQSRVTLL